MRLDRCDQEVIEVVLSRRNLLTLVAKLDRHPPQSVATIIGPDEEGRPTLVVRAEEDSPHYGRRPFGPGKMHPLTEAWLAKRRPVEDERDSSDLPPWGQM